MRNVCAPVMNDLVTRPKAVAAVLPKAIEQERARKGGGGGGGGTEGREKASADKP